MASSLLLETIFVSRHAPKLRHLLRWDPLLRPPQPQLPLARCRVPIVLPLRCCALRPPPAAEEEEKETPLDAALRAVIGTWDWLKRPTAATVLICFLLAAGAAGALAASGGRMGGHCFSSSSSSESSSSSSSSGYGSSSSYWHSAPSVSTPCALHRKPSSSQEDDKLPWDFWLFVASMVVIVVLILILMVSYEESLRSANQKASVIKLQVGLFGTARSFQKDLDQIAEAEDTSTKKGLNYILTETTLALLRNPDYCFSVHSSVDVKSSIEAVEKCFSRLSIEERAKFDEETLVNVNNIRRKMTSNQTSKSSGNKYIVVTILVAAEGSFELPDIKDSKELEKALKKIGSIPTSNTLAAEVMWTPQEGNDTLSEEELREDYPLLRPLQ